MCYFDKWNINSQLVQFPLRSDSAGEAPCRGMRQRGGFS